MANRFALFIAFPYIWQKESNFFQINGYLRCTLTYPYV